MENDRLLPFERNRYYVGKLLTSADFQSEQTYLNHKRQFLNKLFYGDGVVCGLGVYNLDDLSVMVESGVAVDGLGREITVESSVVKKLSTVEGFESLAGSRAILCLRYQEEAVHPVYAVRGQETGDGYECNRIREGYGLFLMDADAVSPVPEPESEFLASTVLYQDADFCVELAIPAVVSAGHQVRLSLTISRRSQVDALFSLDTLLQTPALLGPNGEHELHIALEDLLVPQGAPVVRSYWLTAQGQSTEDSVIIAGAESTRIRVGEVRRDLTENVLLKLAVESSEPEALVARAIGAVSLETRDMAGIRDFIPLAELTVQHTKNSYLIEQVEERGIKRYLQLPSAAEIRARYAGWFSSQAKASAPLAQTGGAEAPGLEGARYQEPTYATGVCEIPLGTGAKRGQTFRSDEIIHGLGKGNVFVQVGFDFLADDPKLDTSSKNTIYGDPQLFAGELSPISYGDLGVKVMHDRGSFVAAVRLKLDAVQPLLTLRWVAVRLPVGDEQSKLQRLAGKSISAVQPTVVLATRESHYINVRFKNMEPCTLTYELTEKDSGDITSDGIYTAPAREGVYEIRISCADMPLVSTYAYAVVKKRDAEEQPG